MQERSIKAKSEEEKGIKRLCREKYKYTKGGKQGEREGAHLLVRSEKEATL